MDTEIAASLELLVSRKEAIATGQTTYFTGEPCGYGHIARRSTKGGCVECARLRSIAWHYAHQEQQINRLKARYEANRESHIVKSKTWKIANKEKWHGYAKAWKTKYPERVKAGNASYLQKNLERHRVNQTKRRGIKSKAEGSFTPVHVQALKRMQKSKCASCECSIAKIYDIDHIMPLALGGSNWPRNLQLLCPPCNRSKGAKHPIVFAKSRGLLL